jgi:hypothetical protein
MARRKRFVLQGPAAEAVERLAKAAGVTPAELIRSALRREDDAQRSASTMQSPGAEAEDTPQPEAPRSPVKEAVGSTEK